MCSLGRFSLLPSHSTKWFGIIHLHLSEDMLRHHNSSALESKSLWELLRIKSLTSLERTDIQWSSCVGKYSTKVAWPRKWTKNDPKNIKQTYKTDHRRLIFRVLQRLIWLGRYKPQYLVTKDMPDMHQGNAESNRWWGHPTNVLEATRLQRPHHLAGEDGSIGQYDVSTCVNLSIPMMIHD